MLRPNRRDPSLSKHSPSSWQTMLQKKVRSAKRNAIAGTTRTAFLLGTSRNMHKDAKGTPIKAAFQPRSAERLDDQDPQIAKRTATTRTFMTSILSWVPDIGTRVSIKKIEISGSGALAWRWKFHSNVSAKLDLASLVVPLHFVSGYGQNCCLD